MVKSKLVLILIVITLPIFIILTSIRVALTPLFVEIEYRMPGFPNDPYGFSFEERLTWAKLSLEYSLNHEGVEFLSNRYLSDGSPLYNSRELKHMDDFKFLVQIALKIWVGLIFWFMVITYWSWKQGWIKKYWYWMARGGWITLAIIFIIILGVLINFDLIFTGFHRIFFEGDSWLFYYDDTFIRLFPERFWQDLFIWLGGLSLIQSITVILLGRLFSDK